MTDRSRNMWEVYHCI